MFPDARAVGRGHCLSFYESNFITRSMLDWSEAGGACGFSPAASSNSSIVLYLEQDVCKCCCLARQASAQCCDDTSLTRVPRRFLFEHAAFVVAEHAGALNFHHVPSFLQLQPAIATQPPHDGCRRPVDSSRAVDDDFRRFRGGATAVVAVCAPGDFYSQRRAVERNALPQAVTAM
jgi:hypothetical protein